MPSRKNGTEKSTVASRSQVGVVMPHTMSSSPAATRSSRSDGVTSWSSSETVRPVFVSTAARISSSKPTEKPSNPPDVTFRAKGGALALVPARMTPSASILASTPSAAANAGDAEARQGRHQQGQGKRKGKRGSHVPERRPTARCGEAQMIANAGHSSPEAMPPMPQAAAHARRRQGPVDFARHDTLFHRTAILDMVLRCCGRRRHCGRGEGLRAIRIHPSFRFRQAGL